MAAAEKRGGLRPPSLLSLKIPEPANIPLAFLQWIGVAGGGTSHGKRRRVVMEEEEEQPAKRARLSSSSSEAESQAGQSWEEAEEVEPEAAQPTGKPLVPYTPSPSPSLPQSREQSPAPEDQQSEASAEEEEEEPEDFDPSQHIEITKLPSKQFKTGKVYKEENWSIKPIGFSGDLQNFLNKFQMCLHYATEKIVAESGAGPEATVQVAASHENMHRQYRSSRRSHAKDFDPSELLDRVETTMQSSKAKAGGDGPGEVTWEDMTWVIRVFSPPTAGSLYTRKEQDPADYAKNAQGIVDPAMKSYRLPKSLSDSCILNCVACGVERLKNKEAAGKATRLKNFIQQELKTEVERLATAAGLPAKGPHCITDLCKVQAALGEDFQISVYKGPEAPMATFGACTAKHHVDLFLHPDKEHVSLITNITAFFSAKGFCQLCKRSRDSRTRHKCQEAACGLCRQAECSNTSGGSRVQCQVCNRYWPSQQCYQAHLMGECSKSKLCKVCWELYRNKDFEDHECGQVRCSMCKKLHSPFDTCFVPTENSAADDSKVGMWEEEDEELDYRPQQQDQEQQEDKADQDPVRIYYDTETASDPVSGKQRVFLAHFLRVGPGGEEREIQFTGPDAMDQFIKAIIPKDSPLRDAIYIAHNNAGFDGHFVYEAALKNHIRPDYIPKGQKLLSITLKSFGVVLKDSLQFLPNTPLRKFPELFGLDCGAKGEFPFKLIGTKHINYMDNPAYRGEDGSRWPVLELFCPENKSAKEAAKLRKWHKDQADLFREDPQRRYFPTVELDKYCRQDVRLLKEGMEIYRRRWLNRYPDMDILNYITLPQFINSLYRRHFMKPNSISPLPPQGFSKANNKGSLEAFGWLQLERRRLRAAGTPLGQLRDGRRGGEIKISGLHVDGCGVDSTGRRHVFQFHGCWWHGCPSCAAKKDRSAEEGQRLKDRHERTLADSARLRALSTDSESPYGLFEYHEIWEHEFLELVKEPAHREQWAKFRKLWPKDPLVLREAFKGGRTNSIMHKVQVPKDHKLVYVDFTSLYPSINYGAKGELYPVGFPKVFIGPDMEEEPDVPKLEEAFGFWKVKVHPPRQLYIPVLPTTVNGKLVFALCRLCAEEERQGLCTHSREERAFQGTFFTEELKKAVEMGYQLDTPQEIWEWPEEQRTGKMFKRFIRELYAQKALNSGKPQSDAEMAEMLEDIRSSVGLKLHPEDFKDDPCQRAQAKFALNNIWGFFGKRGNPPTHKMVATEEELVKLHCNPDIEITDTILMSGGEYLMVKYREKEEKTWRTGSMAVAAMTTGWARLRLYELLQQYEQHVVYFDTDSAFLLLPPGVEGPRTSSKLGDLKLELKPGEFIAFFTSLGPKTYGYKVVDREGRLIRWEIRMKGVPPTQSAQDNLTGDTMRELVDNRSAHVKVEQFTFVRNMIKAGVFGKMLSKKVRFTSTKRMFLSKGANPFQATLPYGYAYDPSDNQETDKLIRLITGFPQ